MKMSTIKQTTFGRTTLTTSQELERATERADKAAAELRRTQAELRVTQVYSAFFTLTKICQKAKNFYLFHKLFSHLFLYSYLCVFS